MEKEKSVCATAYNSAYVHRRLGRRLGLRGAPLRHMAPRPRWPRGRVTYLRGVMRDYAGSAQDIGNTLPRDIGNTS